MAITGQYVSAGDLDRVITIMRVSMVPDAFGQPVATETVFETMRAKRASLVSSDYMRAQLLGSVATVNYQVRYRDGISVGMKVREDNADYFIVSVEEIGRRKGLSLLCKVAE